MYFIVFIHGPPVFSILVQDLGGEQEARVCPRWRVLREQDDVLHHEAAHRKNKNICVLIFCDFAEYTFVFVFSAMIFCGQQKGRASKPALTRAKPEVELRGHGRVGAYSIM